MAAYAQPGYAVAVLVDGKAIREESESGERSVRIPFGSEYKLRIKNKTDRRAYCDVEIDGCSILHHGKRLILQARQTIDIERFAMDGNNLSGKKLKFVEENHGEVMEPGAAENGQIVVRFHPEYQFASGWISTVLSTPLTPYYGGSLCVNNSGGISGGGITNCATGVSGAVGQAGSAQGGGSVSSSASGAAFISSNTTNIGAANASFTSGTSLNLNSSVIGANSATNSVPTAMNVGQAKSDVGATVEGSHSSQQFRDSYEWFNTSSPVEILLRLRGPKIVQPEQKPWRVSMSSQKAVFHLGNHVGGIDSVEINDGKVLIGLSNKTQLSLPLEQVRIET